jgi:hypothetical protein
VFWLAPMISFFFGYQANSGLLGLPVLPVGTTIFPIKAMSTSARVVQWAYHPFAALADLAIGDRSPAGSSARSPPTT